MLNLFQKKVLNFDDIILDRLGEPVVVKVRHSKKARHFSIRIKGHIPELILPNSDINTAHKFLLEKESWIRAPDTVENRWHLPENAGLAVSSALCSSEEPEKVAKELLLPAV